MHIKYTLEILVLCITTLFILFYNVIDSLARCVNNLKVIASIFVWAINFKLISHKYLKKKKIKKTFELGYILHPTSVWWKGKNVKLLGARCV